MGLRLAALTWKDRKEKENISKNIIFKSAFDYLINLSNCCFNLLEFHKIFFVAENK